MRATRAGALHSARDCETFAGETTLVVMTCPVCSVTYAIPERLRDAAQKHNRTTQPRNHWSWCCPMGHELSYPGKNEEQILRDRLRAERDRAMAGGERRMEPS